MHAIAVRIVFIALLCGCDDPAQDVAAAEVTTPGAPAPASAVAAGPGLKITPDNSSIEFEGSKVTGSHPGGFNAFRGTVELPGDDPAQAKVAIEIDTASIYSDSDRLTRHLMNEDFFDVQTFPKATFHSTAIRAGGEGGASHTITGMLELRGVSKEIAFPATIAVSPAKVSASAEFSINRKDFGIVYAGRPDNLIRDLVVIRLRLELPRGG